MKTIDFDYDLPKELIAQKPVFPRDQCRLMALNRQSGVISHRRFFEIEKFLRPGDVLALNDTKVFKARLIGILSLRAPTQRSGRSNPEHQIEIFLLRQIDNKDVWEVLGNPGRKLKKGAQVWFTKNIYCEVVGQKDGKYLARFNIAGNQFWKFISRYGHVPVPPYIKIEPAKMADYQTIYAKHLGSVAAPTAGFHFTSTLLQGLKKIGVQTAFITLHVGYGTFKPIKTERIEEHRMEPEWVEIPKAAAEAINRAKREGRRVVAVGTTVVRALEGVYKCRMQNAECRMSGEINLFIYPGFKFKVVDALITNFHLPKSTLLLLVSAFAKDPADRSVFAGRDLIMKAYGEAIKKKYRFYSFGDAMMIL